jgi:anti-sigma B factor antagonist
VVRGGGRSSDHLGLRISIERVDPDIARIHLGGELDLSTSRQLETDLLSLISSGGCTKIVLDLSELTFLDSTGLRALWTTRQRAQDAGARMVLAAPSESVMRVLRITKLDKVFQVLVDGGTEEDFSSDL